MIVLAQLLAATMKDVMEKCTIGGGIHLLPP